MTIADEDMPDLPPRNVVVTPLELPDAVMATYRTMARELFATIEGRSIEAASPLIATGKLAQLANGFLYDAGADDPVFVHSLKIDWLRELVESLDGEPLLIVYEFIEDFCAAFAAPLVKYRHSAGRRRRRKRGDWSRRGTRARCRCSPCIQPRPGTGSICSTAGRAWRGCRRAGQPSSPEQAIARLYRPGRHSA